MKRHDYVPDIIGLWFRRPPTWRSNAAPRWHLIARRSMTGTLEAPCGVTSYTAWGGKPDVTRDPEGNVCPKCKAASK